MQVHSTLGNGFQEVIYQRALKLEMESVGLEFEREKEMPVYYRGEEIGLLINFGARKLEFKRIHKKV